MSHCNSFWPLTKSNNVFGISPSAQREKLQSWGCNLKSLITIYLLTTTSWCILIISASHSRYSSLVLGAWVWGPATFLVPLAQAPLNQWRCPGHTPKLQAYTCSFGQEFHKIIVFLQYQLVNQNPLYQFAVIEKKSIVTAQFNQLPCYYDKKTFTCHNHHAKNIIYTYIYMPNIKFIRTAP